MARARTPQKPAAAPKRGKRLADKATRTAPAKDAKRAPAARTTATRTTAAQRTSTARTTAPTRRSTRRLAATPDAPVTRATATRTTAAQRTSTARAAAPAQRGTRRLAATPDAAATRATARPRTRAAAPRTSRPARLSGGSAVVKVLESKQPIEALRKFLARISGEATMEQGQIALGSAQLMLLPIAHEHRGGDEVKQLLDLVLARWDAFPDRTGFHAQEFLRNAFAAVGEDRERIARLSALVPADATSELRFNMAAAHAIAGDRPAMLRALEDALAAGATAAQVRRDPDLARFADDPAVAALLDRTAAPVIPVDVAPHVAPVRAALEALRAALHELGGQSRLHPPASLDAVLAAERAGKLQLPNDYRALLTISDGAVLWDHELFGTRDLRGDTALAHRARASLAMSARSGGIGMDACVPLASWGQPGHWLLYDPRGVVRDGVPGYVMLAADPSPVADLAEALRRLEDSIRDMLATN